MTHVRQSVVDVVIFSNCFLYDPADAEKHANCSDWEEIKNTSQLQFPYNLTTC